jgi:AraC-like DNA-binding protein
MTIENTFNERINTTQVDIRHIIKKPAHIERVEHHRLPKNKGETGFSIRKISKDIYFTHSHCFFHQDYYASIDYPAPTTLLIFGLTGYSQFRLATSNEYSTVRQGDIWLIQTDNEKLLRKTVAKQTNEMLVIRYNNERLRDILRDEKSHHAVLAHSQMIRLGHQVKPDHGVTSLLSNHLTTAGHRLSAESEALLLLARWITPQHTLPNSIRHLKQSNGNIVAIIDQIAHRLSMDLVHTPSLKQLAEEANMSHTKLNRYFKRIYGTTIYCWLRHYRLERARHLLLSGQTAITEIAFQCGFSSASHFAQAFKQQYQKSPAEYRNQKRLACSPDDIFMFG